MTTSVNFLPAKQRFAAVCHHAVIQIVFMNRYFFMAVIIVWAACFAGCSRSNKEVEIIQPKLKTNILPGVWELRSVTGGLKPYNPDDYKPGNGDIWRFTDTYFARIYHDSLYNSGSYTITPTGVDMNTNRTISRFVLDDVPAESFELSNDTLNIYYGMIAADGTICHYVKIADDY